MICLQDPEEVQQVFLGQSHLGRYRSWIVPTPKPEDWVNASTRLEQRAYFLDSTKLYERFQVTKTSMVHLILFLSHRDAIVFLPDQWCRCGECPRHSWQQRWENVCPPRSGLVLPVEEGESAGHQTQGSGGEQEAIRDIEE